MLQGKKGLIKIRWGGKKEQGGYLTVFAALLMTVLISLVLVLIEGVRQNAVRLEAEIITDIGLDSIMAEYHREMLAQYNMFWVDTSYGTSYPSPDAVGNHLYRYLEKNCIQDDLFMQDLWYKDFVGMSVGEARITGVSVASDHGGEVFRRRAVEAIRDDIGIAWLEKITEWITTTEEYGLGNRNIEEEKKEVDDNIQEYDGMEKQLSETEWVTVQVNNPTLALEQQRSAGILKLVLEHPEDISGTGVDLSGLLTARIGQGNVNSGNWPLETSQDQDFTDRLFFQEYIMRYGGCFGKEKGKGLLSYQTEYVIAGKPNDTDNLKNVVYRISAFREAANAIYLWSDETKCAEAYTAAAAAASAMLLPEITPLLEASIILGWAYAESLYDVKMLLSGGKVPLLKDADSWHYDISCVFEGVSDEACTANGQGLEYQDYLRILLMLTDLDAQTLRFMDIVEMDIRQTPGNGNFRMDGCIDRVKADILINSLYGYSYQFTRSKVY